MKKQQKHKPKQSYFDFPTWNEALAHIPGVNILLIEFHRKHHGMVKRVAGTVIYKFRQPIGTSVLEQSTLIDIWWTHNGCSYQGDSRKPEYDVDKFLTL